MAINYRLKSPVGATYSVDLDDAWVLKQTLRRHGFYEEPDYGMTPYPDNYLFDAIRRFQKSSRLQVDGVMKPEGETEHRMRRMLETAVIYRCVHCGAPHGGVYSPKVCWQCWNKGLR